MIDHSTTLAVLITYHDESDLLRTCIDSLLASPVKPDEILVYDDASKHPATSYIPSHAPIRIVRNETNRGPGHARNQLLTEATCEFVHFHDADDQFAPDWCDAVKQELTGTELDIVLTEISSYRKGDLWATRVLGLDALKLDSDLVRFCLAGSLLTPSTTVRRSVALRTGGFRTREKLAQSEDFDFHVRLATIANVYTVIDRPLVRINLRTNSHSSDQIECFWSGIKSVEMLSSEIPPEYGSELSMAAVRMATKLYHLGQRKKARAGFRLANSLSPGPIHYGRGPLYEKFARIFGPMAAESVATLYRYLVPANIRSPFRE